MLAFKTSMSDKCKLYENSFSNFIKSNKSIFVNSGSSADLLAITSLVKSPYFNLNKGDKVLVPAITWPTQVWSIIKLDLNRYCLIVIKTHLIQILSPSSFN